MSGRTLVIGDVHGCFDELVELLQVSGWTKADRLVFAGDLVAKGPDSRAVVALAREHKALGVLGNHDAHVLKAREGNASALKGTHREVANALSEDDWRYLELLPLWLDFPELNTLVVHAGLLPNVPVTEQPRHLLLNLRSIDAEGHGSTRVSGGRPWAELWPGPRFVIFGHDALRKLQHHPHALGLDTGCVYGGQLSAVWLPERRLVQVNAKRAYVDVE
ncbi:MAG: metallophosphoesterase [Myxococcaceae bacterium]